MYTHEKHYGRVLFLETMQYEAARRLRNIMDMDVCFYEEFVIVDFAVLERPCRDHRQHTEQPMIAIIT